MFFLNKYSSGYCHLGLISTVWKKLTWTEFARVLIAFVKEQILRGYSTIPEAHHLVLNTKKVLILFYSRPSVGGFTASYLFSHTEHTGVTHTQNALQAPLQPLTIPLPQ